MNVFSQQRRSSKTEASQLIKEHLGHPPLKQVAMEIVEFLISDETQIPEAQKDHRRIRKPLIRVRRRDLDTAVGPLSQREVGLLLGLSERAIRKIERRAIAKLIHNLELRDAWERYLSGQLDESQLEALTPDEIKALLGLVHTNEERQVIHKALRLVQAY